MEDTPAPRPLTLVTGAPNAAESEVRGAPIREGAEFAALALVVDALSVAHDSDAGERSPSAEAPATALTSTPERAMRVLERFEVWPEALPALIDGALARRDPALGAALLAHHDTAALLGAGTAHWEGAGEAFATALLEAAVHWFETLWERHEASAPPVVTDGALHAVKRALDVHAPDPSSAMARAAGRIALLAALDPQRSTASGSRALRALLAHECAREWWAIQHHGAWFATGTAVPSPERMPGHGARTPADTLVLCTAIGQAAAAASRATGRADKYAAHWRAAGAKWLRVALSPVADDDAGMGVRLDDTALCAAFRAAHRLAGSQDAELVETLTKTLETARRRAVALSRTTVAMVAEFDAALVVDHRARMRIATLTAQCAGPEALVALGGLADTLNDDERMRVLRRVVRHSGTGEWVNNVVALLMRLCRNDGGQPRERKGETMLHAAVATALGGLDLGDALVAQCCRTIDVHRALGEAFRAAREETHRSSALDACSTTTLNRALLNLEREDTACAGAHGDRSPTVWGVLCDTLLRRCEEDEGADGARNGLRWLLTFRCAQPPTGLARAACVLDHTPGQASELARWWPGARAWAAARLATGADEGSPERARGRAVLDDIVATQAGETCVAAIREYGRRDAVDAVGACAETAYNAGVPWPTIAAAMDAKGMFPAWEMALRIADRANAQEPSPAPSHRGHA